MGVLHDDKGSIAIFPQRDLADLVKKALIGIEIRLGQPELSRIGTAFGEAGSSLKPNQARSALGEAVIAADR